VRCLGMYAVPHYKGMELCQPDRGGLCISGITKNCSWNQPNRGAQFRRTAPQRLCVHPLSRRAPPRGVPALKPLSQRGVA